MKSQMLGRALFGVLMVFALMLSSCQPSTVVSTLGNVVSLAELAIPVIGSAAGLSPETLTAIVAYLQIVNTAAAQAAMILAGPGTSAEKAAQIVAAFSSIVAGCNCVPPGTPAIVVAAVNAVVQGVARFLANFHQPGIQAESVKPTVIKIRAQDVSALADIQNRAEQNLAKLKGLQK